AEVDEDLLRIGSDRVHPAVEGHALADVALSQFTAGVGSPQARHVGFLAPDRWRRMGLRSGGPCEDYSDPATGRRKGRLDDGSGSQCEATAQTEELPRCRPVKRFRI